MFSLVGRWSNLGGEIWPYWSLNNIVLVLGIRNWLQHFQPLSTASFLSSCPLSLQGLWGWPCTWRLRWHLQGSCAPVLEWCEWQVIRAGSAATEEGAGVSSRLCSKVRTTSASQNPELISQWWTQSLINGIPNLVQVHLFSLLSPLWMDFKSILNPFPLRDKKEDIGQDGVGRGILKKILAYCWHKWMGKNCWGDPNHKLNLN